MEIIAKVSVDYDINSVSNSLVMKVTFKLPNKLFKVKREAVLCSSWWIGGKYKNYNDFQDDVINLLSDIDQLKEIAEDMVTDYIDGSASDVMRANKENEIKKLLKGKQFTITVKLNEK